MINPHCSHVFPLVSDRTVHLCLEPSSARTKHKIAAQAAGHSLGFSWATEVTNHQFQHNFFSQATKGHATATFPNDTHTDSRSQRDAELTCGTKLTNIDRVLPVLQHFGDDEYVNISPVLPVPVLEGKGDRVTTNQQQQQTLLGRRAPGYCKMQTAHLGSSSSHSTVFILNY